jgi:hypothetical protein
VVGVVIRRNGIKMGFFDQKGKRWGGFRGRIDHTIQGPETHPKTSCNPEPMRQITSFSIKPSVFKANSVVFHGKNAPEV